ncbi:serine/threonine receptor-like kinase NFP [Benincasa hispida]|uniref:serine/threonine receptor-like kinase NFP n=1 Tax=Benincasa hispida TaxID=102211 RepID=UPI0019018013|nr:serine/threonine receptor-like kinase NFP [Benincasa hispida]
MTFYALILVLFFFFFFSSLVASDSPPNASVGSSCNLKSVCETYVTFFAKSPEFLDLENVSDLFGVRRSLIAEASNLNPDDNRRLFPGELLLIPVNCTCNGNQYFANITYQIKQGDVYYALAMTSFQNLTEWHVVNESNPNLDPNLLDIGDEVTFPLYCKCPSKTDIQKNINYFITYIWQPTDNISVVSTEFNVSSDAVLVENNYTNMRDATNLPVFIPLLRLPLFSHMNPYNETTKNDKHRWIIVVLLSVGSSILIVILIAGLVCAHFVHKNRKSLKWNKVSVEIAGSPARNNAFGAKTDLKDDRLLPKVSDYLSRPILYDINVIKEATKNLNRCTRIGGSVYRATIDKQVVAIKKSKEDITEELNILQKVNHVNLVKVIGFSIDMNRSCFLVYEYVENGSLDKWLCSSSLASLTWDQRISIALDVSHGLQYMHEHIQPSIVHRDIRTSNILLDSSMKAKLSNLSMAKPALDTTSHKIDIFAFGVVLLELLSGKKATETKGDGEVVMLWKDIREVMDVEEEKKEGGLRTWMDPKLETFYPIDGALSLTDLAMACTHDLPMVRPSMVEIVFNLSLLTHSSSLTSLETSWVLGLDSIEISEKVDTVLAR